MDVLIFNLKKKDSESSETGMDFPNMVMLWFWRYGFLIFSLPNSLRQLTTLK